MYLRKHFKAYSSLLGSYLTVELFLTALANILLNELLSAAEANYP